MKALKIVLISTLLPLIYACSHPIEIRGEGEGDVTTTAPGTGTRGCSLEEYQGAADSCAVNPVVHDYAETYSAEARPGSQFRRWGVYCPNATTNTCSFNIGATNVKKAWGVTVAPLQAIFRPTVNTGFDSLFMGHSFFHPIAGGIASHAINAGFTDHVTNRIEGGGNLGAPEELWNDPVKRAQALAVLDAGDVDVVGVTYFPGYDDLIGYTNWVDAALEKNPDTRFFIGYPWGYQAHTVTSTEYEAIMHAAHPVDIHTKIDALRAQYPGVDFYCIPYYQASVELYKLFDAGALAADGITTLWGNDATSVYSDDFSHPGAMLRELSELVWLRAIYGVDLTTYAPATGYSYDLKALAQAITDQHEPAYNAPPEVYPDADFDGLADRYETDDDNDGIPDGADICPLDPDPACTPITDTVTVDGTVWAQPDLFTSLSWDAINAVCPASNGGICNAGTLNGHYMDGWMWTSVEDVNQLINLYTSPQVLGPGPDAYEADGATASPIALTPPFFRPTFTDNIGGIPTRRMSALTRDSLSDGTPRALFVEILDLDEFAYAAGTYPIRTDQVFDKTGDSSVIGAMFVRVL